MIAVNDAPINLCPVCYTPCNDKERLTYGCHENCLDTAHYKMHGAVAGLPLRGNDFTHRLDRHRFGVGKSQS